MKYSQEEKAAKAKEAEENLKRLRDELPNATPKRAADIRKDINVLYQRIYSYKHQNKTAKKQTIHGPTKSFKVGEESSYGGGKRMRKQASVPYAPQVIAVPIEIPLDIHVRLRIVPTVEESIAEVEHEASGKGPFCCKGCPPSKKYGAGELRVHQQVTGHKGFSTVVDVGERGGARTE